MNCFENDVDINGFDIVAPTTGKEDRKSGRKVGSAWSCQQLCKKTADCEFFTYIIDQDECRMKTVEAFLRWSFERKPGHISGKKSCNNGG